MLEAPNGATGNGSRILRAADTDDRGEYRFGSLVPGAFFVAELSVNAWRSSERGPGGAMIFRPGTQRTYYPAAGSVAEAEAIHLDAGEDRSDIDFMLARGQAGGEPFGMVGGMRPGRAFGPEPDATATGAIRGRVVAAGRTVAGATVRLFPDSPFAIRAVQSDEDGRFEFPDVPAWHYRVAASKPGFTPVNPDDAAVPNFQQLGGGPRVDLRDGEQREDVEVELAPLGTIAGDVSDELGEPIEGVTVQALRVRYETGRRRLVAAGSPRLTDDRGRYRLFDLDPGRYIVSANVGAVGAADIPGYARSYFPGTADVSGAQFVTIGSGGERAAIDFSMVRTATARVGGRVVNAAGEPSAAGSLKLKPDPRSSFLAATAVGALIYDGAAFEFRNVPPGQYIIEADHTRSNAHTEGEYGTLAVGVNGTDITDLVLQTSAGSSIRGRFAFDAYNGTKMPAAGNVELRPQPVEPDLAPKVPATADIHGDWTFEIAGINGLRRLQLTRAPAEWMLEKVLVNGIDATDRPLAFGGKNQSLADVEVMLTDRVTEVAGTVADDHGRPAAGAQVVAFAPDRDRWYPSSRFLRTTSTDADGVFRIRALPPGTYSVAVLPRRLADGGDAWQDPSVLEDLLTRASTIIVGEGQHVVVTLSP